MKWTLLLLLLAGLVVGVVAAVRQTASPPPPAWQWRGSRPLEVVCEPVERRDLVRTVEARAEVDAEVEVDISAQKVARIKKLPFREGETVKTGDLIVELDAENFLAEVEAAEARVTQLEAGIEVAKADITKADRDWERSSKLADTRAVTAEKLADLRTLLDQAQAKLRLKEAELEEARSRLAKARADLRDTTTYSPINGIVSRLIAQEGEVAMMGTINTPGTVIMVVSDPNTMFLRAWIDEADAPLIRPGQRTRIYTAFDEHEPLWGDVRRLAPKAAQSAGQARGPTAQPGQERVAKYEAWIDLAGQTSSLLLGMNANVEIEVDSKSAVLSVPVQAVLQRRGKELPPELLTAAETMADEPNAEQAKLAQAASDPRRRSFEVVAVRTAGKCQLRAVRTGIADDRRVEIVSGLSEGEEVVSGPYRVLEQLKQDAPLVDLPEEPKQSPVRFGFD